jgi:hypothetical protein
MMRQFYILFALLFLTACNDGDVLTVDLQFDKELSMCTNNTESFLIYDLREDPSESLSLIIPRGSNQEYPFTLATETNVPTTFTINASSNRFIYRTYNRAVGNTELCEAIPPANLTITEDYEATSGTAHATVVIEDDDGDGVPNEFEGISGEPNEEGIYMDSLDTDGDGFPNYIDEDDDNDNVPTRFEIDNSDGDNDPTTNPLNSDTNSANPDNIPDYLDTDDDGDGVPTRNEDSTDNQDPRSGLNQNFDSNGELEYYYLNPLENSDYGDIEHIGGNTYTRTVTVSFLVTDFNLEILSATELDLGTLTYTIEYVEEDED